MPISIRTTKIILIREGIPTPEYASNTEKWLIIILLIVVGVIVISSILLYGPQWLNKISGFI